MTCTTCGEHAAWQSEGLWLCRWHAIEAATRGRAVTLAPVPAPDVAERLEAISGWEGDTAGVELCAEAAAEIRRLRARVAELESGQSASAGAVACGRTLDGGSSSTTEG